MASVDLRAMVREVADFPKPGVGFKDITTVLKDAEAFREVVRIMAEPYRSNKPDLIVGIESRGFILGAPIAYELGCGFVVVRKAGKLPAETISMTYQLEYGEDTLEIHKDAIAPGQKVVIVDDLLATGGTIAATAQLIEQLHAKIIGFSFFIELSFLSGRRYLEGYDIRSLITYDA